MDDDDHDFDTFTGDWRTRGLSRGWAAIILIAVLGVMVWALFSVIAEALRG